MLPCLPEASAPRTASVPRVWCAWPPGNWLRCGTGGLDSWLGAQSPREVFEAIGDLDTRPLTRARLNQLLTLSHEAPISQPLFSYYWLKAPAGHPYNVIKIPGFDESWTAFDSIRSVDQLYWGLYRFYVDALLFFGNIRTAYQRLRQLSDNELNTFFGRRHVDAEGMRTRGEPLLPGLIAKATYEHLGFLFACGTFGRKLEVVGNDQGRGGWDFRLKEAKSLTSDWTLLRNKPVYLVLNVEELEKEGGNTRHREIVFINGEMFLKDSLCAKARIIAKIAATKLTRLSITSSDWTADDTGLAITNTIIMASTTNQTNQIRIAV